MRRDPFVGFGDDQNTSIKFQVVRDRGDAGDWSGGDPVLSRHKMGNSSVEVTQFHGYTPWEATVRLLFDSSAALAALKAVAGIPSTLRILWGTTLPAGGTKQTILDTDYLVLPDTILVSLTPTANTGLINGPRTATATFRRAFVPSPYVGFTLLSPEES